MTRWIGTAAALALLAGPLLPQETEARAIVARLAETYAHAQDLTLSAKAAADIQLFGMRQRVGLRQSVVFQRPNRLRLESAFSGGGTRTVVCDGRQVYVHQDVTREYTRRPAPQTLCEIRDLQDDAPLDFGAVVDLPTLLDGADLSERIEDVTVERTGTYAGVPTHVLSLTLKGGHTERLWIGKDDCLVRKLEFRMNPAGAFAGDTGEPQAAPADEAPAVEGDAMDGAGGLEAFQEALQGMMLQAFRMELTWTERYRDIRLNAGAPAEAFRFRPRPGDRCVERLSEIPVAEPASTPLPPPASGDLTGQVAPDFTLPDLNGTPTSLSQLRGKPVLLYFWDSLCAACLVQLPEIQALHETHAEAGLQVVAVNVDRALDMAKASTEQAKLTFPVLWQDPADPAAEQLNATYRPEELPRLLVIDAIGIVRADLTGYRERAEIEAALAAAR